MNMTEKEHRPALSPEEIAEKIILRQKYDHAKKLWPEKNNGEKLTDNKLGELVAKVLNREDPFSQGAVWQFTSIKSNTRPPEEFVIGMAVTLGFDVEEVSPKYLEIIHKYDQYKNTNHSVNEKIDKYQPALVLSALQGKVTPRTQIVLERLAKIDAEQGVSEQDINILKAIIERYEAK